jgi:hypothetical protein
LISTQGAGPLGPFSFGLCGFRFHSTALYNPGDIAHIAAQANISGSSLNQVTAYRSAIRLASPLAA